MIISHENKYVFIELPMTGTTAISRELRHNYKGASILHKHATYREFLKKATPVEKKYCAFSCIRNPMDQAVSSYFHLKNANLGDTVLKARNKRIVSRLLLYLNLRRHYYVKRNGCDFADYFLRFYWLPYDNWSCLFNREHVVLLRFERLAEDFSLLIRRLGLEEKRLLPRAHETKGKSGGYLSHFTPKTICRAKRVFGPYMEKWGYQFPQEWGADKAARLHKLENDGVNLVRKQFWAYMRQLVYIP